MDRVNQPPIFAVTGRRWPARLAVVPLAASAALAFPQPALSWWGWIGVTPVIVLIALSPSRREALARSWLAGIGYLTALHYWVIPHTGVFTAVLGPIVGLFWLPIGLVSWWSLGPQAGSEMRRAAVVLVPSVWVLVEWVRSWEYFGGTWGLLGLTQWKSTLILQGAALGGVWLLSFAMVATNTVLAASVLPGRSPASRISFLAVAAGFPLLLVVYGLARPELRVDGNLAVGGVQPGVYDTGRDRFDAHVESTLDLEDSGLDVIVWGQTSVAFDPAIDTDIDAQLTDLTATMGVDILVNVDDQTQGGIVKTTVQYTESGPISEYGKQRLVPFGEYIPLRPLLGWIADFTQAATEDRARGQSPTLLTVAGRKLGPLISYESTFPDMRRALARLGAEITVVQGGTQTFQGTWAQPQQASYEAVNAVASGRPAVLVAVSGVSAAFGARGQQLMWHPADWTGAFVVDVPLSTEDTWYVRLGDWVVWLSVLVLSVAIVARLARRVAERQQPSQAR